MQTNREKLMELIEKKFNLDFISTTEDFSGSKGGIWLSAENGEIAKDGYYLFDYYTEHRTKYFFGVHKDFKTFCEKRGWYCSWNDPGTLMIWPN